MSWPSPVLCYWTVSKCLRHLDLRLETYPSTLEATLLRAGSHRMTEEFLIAIVLLRLELLLLYPKASLMTAGGDDDGGRVQ